MKEITKEEAINLETGTIYYVYNPLTKDTKETIASPIDIVHNKYCYENLKFYIKENENNDSNV